MTIAFVQMNYAVPQTPQATVAVSYTGAQSAGNLNVVIIGWSDASSQVTSVTDAAGNVYTRAVGPTVQPGVQSQAMYYAAGIAGGAGNVVTVSFSGPVSYPDVRIAEYRGIDASQPVDAVAGAAGSGATSNSGPVTTTTASVLLVTGNYVTTVTTAAGAGYTSRVITTPNGSLLADRVVTTPGTYAATASLSAGGWVMQVVAFRGVGAGSGETEPPTAPTNVTATVAGSTQINLTWTAATDNVGVTEYRIERCQSAGCSTFTQVGTATGVSFSNPDLSPATSYSYRVRAADAAGNLGPYSTTVSATTNAAADTQPPTAPTNVAATAVGSTQINLTWTAATDNVGVTEYRIERCQSAGCSTFTQVGTATAPSFSNMGLSPATSYSYRVRAVDAAGNLGPYSTIVSATTGAAPPVTIAFVQMNYAVPQTPQATVAVSYTGAQSAGNLNVVIIGWSDASSQVTSVTDAAGNVYTRAVGPTVQPGVQSQAMYYAAGIAGGAGNVVTVSFSGPVSYPDVRIAEYRGIDASQPVDAVAGAAGSGATSNSGPVTTTTASVLLVTGNYVTTVTTAAGAGYTSRVITTPNGSLLADRVVTTPGTYAATASLSAGGWVMQVVAFRGVGAGSGETEPPTAPTNLTATVAGGTQINLSWTASTDNVGVAGYRIERCAGTTCSNFAQIGASSVTSHGDTVTVSGTYRYRVRAFDASGNFSEYSNVAEASIVIAPPTLTISSPLPGSAISGSTTLMATASNGPLLAGVQFQVDNVNVGPALTGPYEFALNTSLFSNGTHTIRAYAWDEQRNVITAEAVSVTFSNATASNPAQSGLWSGILDWPLVAIHMSLMSDGRIMAWDKMNLNPDPQVWDPVTSSFRSAALGDPANLFCAGHLTLPDGRLFSVGGHMADHVGLAAGRIFNPATNVWTSTPDMSVGRWYPTATTLSDGRILVLGGETNCANCDAPVPEIYDPVSNTWSQLPLASLAIPYYPHAFVLPDGKVGVTSTTREPTATRVLDVATQSWTTTDSRLLDAYSAAMYLPGKVLKTGTATGSDDNGPSASTAYVIDWTAPSPAWRQVQSMAFPRAYHVEIVLPDGSVLVTGGGRTTLDYGIANAVYEAELWSPSSETWTTLARMHAPRLYHGSAVLLPDGRVLVAGGGRSPGPDPRDQLSAEIFAPPYLFKGPRPTIATAPSQLTHAATFTVGTPDGSRIAKVSLMGLGSMTHGIDMNQRFVPLPFTATSNTLTVTAPGVNLAPPGVYMLFIVDENGVPSVASFVRF